MKRLADQTYYEILEVSPGASAEEIQAAYEKARALYGPGSIVTYTLMEPDEAALLESRIEDARTTLLDPERRASYDEALQQPEQARAAAVAGAAAVSPIASAEPMEDPAAPRDVVAPPVPEPTRAAPAILLGAALESAGPAGDEAAPAPRPILLQRVVSPPAEREAPAADPAVDESDAAEASVPEEVAVSESRAERATPPPAPAPAAAPASPPLPDAWTGDALRQMREARGLSIEQIAARTKITRHHIENIEADRFASLPAHVYLRGILLTMARELRLDGQKVARSYIERIPPGMPAPAPAPKTR